MMQALLHLNELSQGQLLCRAVLGVKYLINVHNGTSRAHFYHDRDLELVSGRLFTKSVNNN